MNTKAGLELYRTFYLLTRHCQDKSLKLYIRRWAAEDFRAARGLSGESAGKEFSRLKGEAEVVRRQMALREKYFH